MVNKELGDNIELTVKMNKRTYYHIIGLLTEQGLSYKKYLKIVKEKETNRLIEYGGEKSQNNWLKDMMKKREQ